MTRNTFQSLDLAPLTDLKRQYLGLPTAETNELAPDNQICSVSLFM